MLLFSTSLNKLRDMLCEFKISTEAVGLGIHPDKTKILSNQNKTKEITVDNIKIEILEKRPRSLANEPRIVLLLLAVVAALALVGIMKALDLSFLGSGDVLLCETVTEILEILRSPRSG